FCQTFGATITPARCNLFRCKRREIMRVVIGAVIAAALATPAIVVAQSSNSQTTVPASGGDITFMPIQHASVQVEHAGKVIQVDPAMGDFSNAKQADLVLVTDIHGDH